MNVFQFVGAYWWLAFPLFGIAAGAGRAWQRALQDRHARRLEILKAKGQLGASPNPAVAATPVTASTPASTPASALDDPDSAQLPRLFTAHDDITHRWLEYELDVAKVIAFPAMSDGRQPLTAAFLRAKRVADGLRPASEKAKLTRDQLVEYRNAVTDYEVAFDVAERDARRIKDSGFSIVERKRLDTAKQLLTVAINQAATPAERQLAYRRVRDELDGLLSLSDEAIEILEKRVSLELTERPSAAPTASSAVPAPSSAAPTPSGAESSSSPPASPSPSAPPSPPAPPAS